MAFKCSCLIKQNIESVQLQVPGGELSIQKYLDAQPLLCGDNSAWTGLCLFGCTSWPPVLGKNGFNWVLKENMIKFTHYFLTLYVHYSNESHL